MSVARARSAHYAEGTFLIVAGGVDGSGNMLSSVERFSDGEWTNAASLPVATEG